MILEEVLNSFTSDISRGRLVGSDKLSLRTVNILREVVKSDEWSSTGQLIDLIKKYFFGHSIIDSEAIIGNIARRVLKLIREEHVTAVKNSVVNESVMVAESTDDVQESLHKMVVIDADQVDGKDARDFGQIVPDLRAKITDAMDELVMELETSTDEIANQALEHIHANEVILTVGRSKTVEKFLRHAGKERKFQLIIAEGAPFYHGHELAANLAKTNKNIVQITVITDSAVFAVMSRVNKVFVGASAVLADGGLNAICGVQSIARAAKYYSVPMYVCASLVKLTPKYSISTSENRFASPREALQGVDGAILKKSQSITPVFEYVPPGLVTLFVSNVSGYAPSYIYRLLAELYHSEDYHVNE